MMMHSLPKGSTSEPVNAAAETRLCTRCGCNTLDKWKTCGTCRAKKNKYRADFCAKSALSVVQFPSGAEEPQGTSDVQINAKRRAKIAEEGLSNVLERIRMKKRMKKTYIEKEAPGLVTASVNTDIENPNQIEYQTASGLYKALKVKAKTKQFHFEGSYSIVSTDTIDNAKRGRLVVEELRKIAQLSFAHDKPILNGSKTEYKCTCLAGYQPQPQPHTPLEYTTAVSKSIPPKPKQSDLSAWAGFQPKSSAFSGTFACTGKVIITAENDFSHPVGIKGQKITVKVLH